jgi:hypothetical protein
VILPLSIGIEWLCACTNIFIIIKYNYTHQGADEDMVFGRVLTSRITQNVFKFLFRVLNKHLCRCFSACITNAENLHLPFRAGTLL